MKPTSTTLFALACASLVLTACDDDGAPPPPAGDDTRTVRGTFVTRFRGLDGALLDSVPEDLHAVLLQAHFKGADGAWQRAGGSGGRDGSFTIPRLPRAGHYWLQVSTGYFLWTDADALELGGTLLGPFDPPADLDGPVSVELTATGLAPWGEGDELGYHVPGALVFDQNVLDGATDHAPAAGATELHGLAIDWLGRPLARAAAGDRRSSSSTRR